MGVRRALVGSLVAVAAIRASLACGGSGGDADPGAALPDRNLDDGAAADGTSGGDGAVPSPPPSFCDGIVFYASLDTKYDPEVGSVTPGTAFGSAELVPQGKFAGATLLVDDAGSEAGAAIYYDTPPNGGVPWYPANQGTVSLWYRGNALEPSLPGTSPVLWRAVGSIPPAPVVGGGLLLAATAGSFGLILTPPGGGVQPILTFPIGAVSPYVKKGDYNHFVTGWTRGDAGGPAAVLAVNGGFGTRYDDGGADPYADASPNDAGDLLVPYRASRARPWDDDASTLAFRLGGTGQSASEGAIDDVVVWNRVLSFVEIEAVYAVDAPIGDVCKLH